MKLASCLRSPARHASKARRAGLRVSAVKYLLQLAACGTSCSSCPSWFYLLSVAIRLPAIASRSGEAGGCDSVVNSSLSRHFPNPQLSFGLPPFGRVPGFEIAHASILIAMKTILQYKWPYEIFITFYT
jgi:hypothetical protein